MAYNMVKISFCLFSERLRRWAGSVSETALAAGWMLNFHIYCANRKEPSTVESQSQSRGSQWSQSIQGVWFQRPPMQNLSPTKPTINQRILSLFVHCFCLVEWGVGLGNSWEALRQASVSSSTRKATRGSFYWIMLPAIQGFPEEVDTWGHKKCRRRRQAQLRWWSCFFLSCLFSIQRLCAWPDGRFLPVHGLSACYAFDLFIFEEPVSNAEIPNEN